MSVGSTMKPTARDSLSKVLSDKHFDLRSPYFDQSRDTKTRNGSSHYSTLNQKQQLEEVNTDPSTNPLMRVSTQVYEHMDTGPECEQPSIISSYRRGMNPN
jgi:hypothetical protein